MSLDLQFEKFFGFFIFYFLRIDLTYMCRRKVRGIDSERALRGLHGCLPVLLRGGAAQVRS